MWAESGSQCGGKSGCGGGGEEARRSRREVHGRVRVRHGRQGEGLGFRVLCQGLGKEEGIMVRAWVVGICVRALARTRASWSGHGRGLGHEVRKRAYIHDLTFFLVLFLLDFPFGLP